MKKMFQRSLKGLVYKYQHHRDEMKAEYFWTYLWSENETSKWSLPSRRVSVKTRALSAVMSWRLASLSLGTFAKLLTIIFSSLMDTMMLLKSTSVACSIISSIISKIWWVSSLIKATLQRFEALLFLSVSKEISTYHSEYPPLFVSRLSNKEDDLIDLILWLSHLFIDYELVIPITETPTTIMSIRHKCWTKNTH